MIEKINYIEIQMPSLSPTMTKGKFLGWKKKIGDKIKVGDALFEIETDKAVMEYESAEEGFLAVTFVKDEEDDVEVGKIVCIFAVKKEDLEEVQKMFINGPKTQEISSLKEDQKVSKEKEASNKEDRNHVKQEKSCAKNSEIASSRIKASPIAKRLANENEINLKDIENGSGPMGRIVKEDVLNAINNHKSETKSHSSKTENFSKNNERLTPERIEITQMRRVIGDRLLQSKITIPHFYLSIDLIMDDLLELRKKINSGFEHLKQNYKVTINDLFIKVIAKALELQPNVNVSWQGTHINQNKTIDISVAVAIENGLITPIVFNANKLSIAEVSIYSKEMVEKAKLGKLKPHEFQGGSITISNLGMMNIDEFYAIINPPQSAIIGIGGVKKKAIVLNDEIKIRQITKITLSCDHRVVDGMTAALFLNKIQYLVENPELILS